MANCGSCDLGIPHECYAQKSAERYLDIQTKPFLPTENPVVISWVQNSGQEFPVEENPVQKSGRHRGTRKNPVNTLAASILLGALAAIVCVLAMHMAGVLWVVAAVFGLYLGLTVIGLNEMRRNNGK